MYRFSLSAAALAAVLLAGCGGGGSSSGPGYVAPNPLPSMTTAPSPGALATQTLNGAAGFVSSSGRTVYVFDADLAALGTSTCSGACAGAWPPLPAASGVTYASPWSTIARSDGITQLLYNQHPLYMFAGDSAAGQTNGDGLIEFGAAWHIARPQGVTGVTPPTGSTPPPGIY